MHLKRFVDQQRCLNAGHVKTPSASAFLTSWGKMAWPDLPAGRTLPVCSSLPKGRAALERAVSVGLNGSWAEADAARATSAGHRHHRKLQADASDYWQGRATVLLDDIGAEDRAGQMLIGDVVGVRSATAGEEQEVVHTIVVEVPSVVNVIEDEAGIHPSNDVLRHYHFLPIPEEQLFSLDPLNTSVAKDADLERFLSNQTLQTRAVEEARPRMFQDAKITMKTAQGADVARTADLASLSGFEGVKVDSEGKAYCQDGIQYRRAMGLEALERRAAALEGSSFTGSPAAAAQVLDQTSRSTTLGEELFALYRPLLRFIE